MTHEGNGIRAGLETRPVENGGDMGVQGRFSARCKAEVVLRLLRGEDLDALSRELRVMAATMARWRDCFLLAGGAALKSRNQDSRDEEIRRLQAKVGEITMENELLRERSRAVEAGFPLARRRSRP